METILNFAWALCSAGLIWLWLGTLGSKRKRVSRASWQMQLLCLGMVVVLLLPVISLSDDLVAAQGLAETDSCLRRATHVDQGHPLMAPALTRPEESLPGTGIEDGSRQVVESDRVILPASFVTSALDSRPPPMAG